MRLKLWLNKAFGLAEGISRLAPSTIAIRRRALERTINDIITTPTSCELTMKLSKQVRPRQGAAPYLRILAR
jgi:transposase